MFFYYHSNKKCIYYKYVDYKIVIEWEINIKKRSEHKFSGSNVKKHQRRPHR